MEMSDFTMKIVEDMRDMKDRNKWVILMNSKSQFHQPAAVWSTYSQGL